MISDVLYPSFDFGRNLYLKRSMIPRKLLLVHYQSQQSKNRAVCLQATNEINISSTVNVIRKQFHLKR